MKSKIIFFISIGLLLFASCDPNKDLYDDLDALRPPYAEELSITLTDENYEDISSHWLELATNEADSALYTEIKTLHSFSATREAAILVPPLLADEYLALDSGSVIKVYYNYDHAHVFTDADMRELGDDDYTAIGGEVADSGFFFAAHPAEDYLPAALSSYFPSAAAEFRAVVKYKFGENSSSTNNVEILYQFDGTDWTIPENSHVLTADDYDSMGAPGNYDNFSSDATPEYYLPIFLTQKYPYATSKTQIDILYKYYGGGNKVISVSAFYDGDTWTIVEEKLDQFIHNGTDWVFDPTVKFSMQADDYIIIVDYIANHAELNVYKHEQYDTEYYYGASASYNNFDMRVSKRIDKDALNYLEGLTDDEIRDVIFERLSEAIPIMLTGKFAEAQPFSNGVPVYYEVTFNTYEPERHKYMVRCLCTEVGTFEFTEGPTLVE